MKRFSKEDIKEELSSAQNPLNFPCSCSESKTFIEIIKQLLSDNEEMEKALEFYAKKETYE